MMHLLFYILVQNDYTLYNKFYIVLLYSVKLVMSKVAVPYNNMGEMAMEHLIKGKMVSVLP